MLPIAHNSSQWPNHLLRNNQSLPIAPNSSQWPCELAIGKPTDEIATAFMRLRFHRSKQLLWRLGNCAPSRIRSHKRVGAGAYHLHVKLRLPTGRALRAMFCTRVLVANARLVGRRASEQMGPTSDANSPVGLDNGRECSVFGGWSDPS